MMADGSTWTQPRSLTFCERTKLTLVLLFAGLRMRADWMAQLWLSGATVSFPATDPRSGRLLIVNARRPDKFGATGFLMQTMPGTVTPE
jgi:hypothetical protein